ncbi:LysR substrate-binding domain-containing protein [Aquincola tertiaricarbonis]|uniref:LysR substrate-binding domain-containing protein n=1 Tax=Aquincola tertiaricarbonis TaxID=391953 RepID=A0ABY4S8T3_AQUTE|nr:LysR substrate-binding domain-containing protein [Aquincola tertiaricarbonis]URI07491.1 LysR substrate-binding domain-containing protein [Aquincola tertiaricarbonis]
MPTPPSTNKPTGIQLDIAADLHKWRAFLAIGELGSLTRAALFLDSNQSLLSRQLNALERECGTRLFTRTGRGVELSEVGRRIFPQVKALLADAQQLEREIRGEAHELSGRVTVGLLPSIGSPLVGRLYKEMRTQHPKLGLKILEGSSGQVEEWLADARIDIAILYRYGASLPDHEEALATVDSYLIGPRGDRLTAADELPLTALHELPFILPSAPNGLRTALDAMARQAHITLVPALEADSLPLQKLLVAQERLYTVLPLHAVWQELQEGRLQAARLVNPPLQRSVSMALARQKGPAKAVTAVAAQIVRIVGDMARSGMWHSSQPTAGLPPAA